MKNPQNILITGASSGLGRAFAIEYSSPGVSLFLSGRNLANLEKTAHDCKINGAHVETEILDVSDLSAMTDWIDKIETGHALDLVIANAGISGGTAGSGEDDDQTRNIFATNMAGTLNTILPAIKYMKHRKAGQIAIISSLASFRGLPGAPSYSASKAAIRVYGEAIRGELSDYNIDVSVICPGYIKTPMTDVNKFPMPLLMTSEKAAAIIKQRLKKNPSRIAFPFLMYAIVWLMGCLPPGLTDPIFKRLPKKARE